MNDPTTEMDEALLALPLKQRVTSLGLKKLMQENEDIERQQQRQIQQLKIKYEQLMGPLLSRISQIIQGGQLKQIRQQNIKQYYDTNQWNQKFKKGKVIDTYWNSVLSNSSLVDQITEKDQNALKFLIDIQIIYNNKQTQNHILKFIFKSNPYFIQNNIIRELKIKDNKPLCIEGDRITWKEGNYLTHQTKKRTNKNTKQTQIIQGKKIKSFFDIFMDWNASQPQQLSRAANIMTQLAQIIVPDSLSYFLGLVEPDDNSSEDDDEEDYPSQEQSSQK